MLGVGLKAALAADRTSYGTGLASGSPRAAAYLFSPLEYFARGAGQGCKFLVEKVVVVVVVVRRLCAARAGIWAPLGSLDAFWLGLLVSTFGGAARSASMLMMMGKGGVGCFG